MQPFRFLLPVFVLWLCASLSGCFYAQTELPVPKRTPVYHKVMSTDFEGRRIAEYISEGEVIKTDDGFLFAAVQRRIFQPKVLEFRYPLGRVITVKTPNVIIVPATKPTWLRDLDRDAMAADGKTEVEVDPPGASNAN